MERQVTRFCFTPPLQHIHDFAPYQDFTFALSFLLENERYRAWLDGLETNYVILDNSFNETQIPVTVEEVVELFRTTYCDVVVQPDADNWTSQQMIEAYVAVADQIGPEHVMGIFRNQLERDWLYQAGAHFTALSYWWRDNWAAGSNFRGVHFLGLGDRRSLVLGADTLDTTIPIKMAIRGERIEDWDGHKPRQPENELRSADRLQRAWNYFNTVMTDEQLELAVHNIQIVKAWAKLA